jgi:hypothetical protein
MMDSQPWRASGREDRPGRAGGWSPSLARAVGPSRIRLSRGRGGRSPGSWGGSVARRPRRLVKAPREGAGRATRSTLGAVLSRPGSPLHVGPASVPVTTSALEGGALVHVGKLRMWRLSRGGARVVSIVRMAREVSFLLLVGCSVCSGSGRRRRKGRRDRCVPPPVGRAETPAGAAMLLASGPGAARRPRTAGEPRALGREGDEVVALYALFFIDRGRWSVYLAGLTAHPVGAWLTQQERDLVVALEDQVVPSTSSSVTAIRSPPVPSTRCRARSAPWWSSRWPCPRGERVRGTLCADGPGRAPGLAAHQERTPSRPSTAGVRRAPQQWGARSSERVGFELPVA